MHNQTPLAELMLADRLKHGPPLGKNWREIEASQPMNHAWKRCECSGSTKCSGCQICPWCEANIAGDLNAHIADMHPHCLGHVPEAVVKLPSQ